MFFGEDKYKKQREVIFEWLSSVVSREDIILVEQDGRRSAYFFEFPLKIGDRPKKINNPEKQEPSFLIRFFSDERSRGVYSGDKWQAIFKMTGLEVWANKEKILEKGLRPLFLGLREEERVLALKIARKSLEFFLKERRKPAAEDLNFEARPSSIFNVKVDLDVALWVDGVLRGSSVVERLTLREAIIDAAILAARDSRFKPLKYEELSLAKIEITLFSDLRIPINEDFIKKNDILYDKGYLLKAEKNQGWFLPEIFNVTKFKGLKEFLSRLGTEKAGIDSSEVFNKKTEIYIFEVQDFIEGENDEVLDLDGPTVKLKNTTDINESAMLAANWLLNIQEPEGNFPPIINPLSGQKNQIDWPRLAFSAWCLVELGKTTGEKEYIEAGRKSFFYLKKYLLDENVFVNPYQVVLAFAYMGKLALSLGYLLEALDCGYNVIKKERSLSFEPIIFCQLSGFFLRLSMNDRGFLEPALKLADIANNFFEDSLRENKEMVLAVWAELANVYAELFVMSGQRFYFDRAKKILNWLVSHQLESGAFRATNKSEFVYTRGVGKVAEVLAAAVSLNQIDGDPDINYYKQSLEKSFCWLAQMQYKPENTYFVPGKNLKNVLGGFRHDYFNYDLWIDSAGHFILATSRYLNHRDMAKNKI